MYDFYKKKYIIKKYYNLIWFFRLFDALHMSLIVMDFGYFIFFLVFGRIVSFENGDLGVLFGHKDERAFSLRGSSLHLDFLLGGFSLSGDWVGHNV